MPRAVMFSSLPKVIFLSSDGGGGLLNQDTGTDIQLKRKGAAEMFICIVH